MEIPVKRKMYLLSFVAVVSFFAYYIYAHITDFKQISFANPELVILLILIALITAVFNGLIIKYLAEPFLIKLHFKEWFGLATITTFYNTIMPFRSGLFAKAAYLKKKHSFSFTNFMAMMAGVYVINFFVVGIFGLFSLAVIYFTHQIFNLLATLLFAGILLVTSAILIFSPKLAEVKNEFLNKVIRVINGWHLIKDNRRILIVSSAVAVLQIVISSYAAIISFRIIHLDLDLPGAILITSTAALSVLIGITPANLGISEGFAIITGWVLGISTAQSLTAALIRRTATTLISFILGPIFSYLLLKHKPGE